ncbi:MAG: hypothetical protein U0163_21145 [Gemmatimonadaceae bacterium]
MGDLTRKNRRKEAVLNLIRSRSIGSQRELVQTMRQAGLETTQASISRDIRELGLVKIGGSYQALSDIHEPQKATPPDPVLELIISFEPVGANLIVIRTTTGSANSVAVRLDREHRKEVAGTLAGDDTIFIAVRSRSDQGRVIGFLRSVIRARKGGA